MERKKGFTRRSCVKGSAAAVTASLVIGRRTAASGNSQSASTQVVPQRPLGKTGTLVSCLGVGGYHLGLIKEDKESTELVARALDAGVNFFDNCWEYHDGVSEERLAAALKWKRAKAFVIPNVCTNGRGNAAES